MRGWMLVVVAFGLVGCKDKELEAKLAASEARVAATEARATACDAKRTELEAKVSEQERSLTAAKAETATLRSTLPPITAKPAPHPAGKPVSLGF